MTMPSQVERVEQLIPGVTTRYPSDYDDREEWERDLGLVFRLPEASAAHDKCKELQERLNSVVAPDVVVGKVTTTGLKGAVPSLGNKSFSLPMDYADAASLYKQLDPSLVGVELRGDVLDTDLRRSHEILASKLELPSCLAQFAFPEEVRRIHETLCPSAESIRVEPYKMILYGTGDFFVPHRDSMDHDEHMFGTISLGLPISAPAPDATKTEASEEEESSSGVLYDDREGERVGDAGQLVLFVGYHGSDASVDSDYYNYEETKKNMLTYVVDMKGLVSDASHGEDGGVSLTMSYGAWTGDVLHEVRRVDRGYRAVLTYKLFKEGHRESYIPASLRDSVGQEVRAIVTALSALPSPPADAPQEGARSTPFHLGFALRHGYPPAGLKPQCLKGIDAIVYSIVSPLYEVALFTGYEVRSQEMYEMHALPSVLYSRIVFVTQTVPHGSLYDEEARGEMARKYPIVANTVWLSLGYGALEGGGFCFGNMDCGTDWWYRQSYLLVGKAHSG